MGLPIKSGLTHVRQDGVSSFVYERLRDFGIYRPLWNTVTSRRPLGTNIFDLDWDLLVVLDACRPDLLSTANSVITPSESTQIRSVGSMSPEWMLQTFTEDRKEDIAETGYISGNIWSHRIFNEQFHSTKITTMG